MSLHPVRVVFSWPLFTSLVFFGLLTAQTGVANITLQQANGETLTLAGPAKRIITLAPNLAELLFAAGAGTQLKAVVEYSRFPAQVARLPRVGDAFRIDLERILEYEPDLVIAWKSGNSQTALQKLKQLGITVWQIEITRPGDIAEVVENMSRAAGTEAQGVAVARQLQDRLTHLRQQNSNKTPVDYFYQIATRPLYTVNGQHIISHSLEICGGVNVFSDLPALAPQISREAVVLANPQAMIAPEISGEAPALQGWQEWPRLQAVENNSMIYLPADEISQATPRLLDSIELACKLLDEIRTTIKPVEK
ncbi:MAG: cobalamin-binding protein [Gammaproteobacteria bacterium]|nr:cobalamin-binding protein [Gammaproteobacteria bacterium]